ncbi:MAG: hypothetical protein LIP18_05560 [Planctomycetes bacterium]|nr:hypothetical protein [Planctomycetota bacterium]
MIDTGMFVYPWDIGDVGDFTRDYAATGLNAVAPSLSYHHGNVLQARTGRVGRIDRAAVSFVPNPALYRDIVPAVHRETADRGVAMELRNWCRETGRHFSAWTVFLHNSTIGAVRPDLCVENHAGDRYRHALCPSNPEVRYYSLALVCDICDQFRPDSLLAESATYRTALHGDHHEIANTRVGPAALWLLSLCFCPHCLEKTAAAQPDLDVERVRALCGRLLVDLLNREVAIPGNDMAQLASLFLEYPELHQYQIERQRRVTEFIGDIWTAAHSRSVELRVFPSSTPFDICAAFLEGYSFRDSAGVADVLVPLLYSPGETFPLVRNTIRLQDMTTPLGIVLTLHPARYPGRADFLGAVREAFADGERPRCVYVYNYSLASRERLSWLPVAVRIIQSADKAGNDAGGGADNAGM